MNYRLGSRWRARQSLKACTVGVAHRLGGSEFQFVFLQVYIYFAVCGWQMADAYSSWVLTLLFCYNACDFTVVEACWSFLFSLFSVLCSLLGVLCMYVVHLRFACSSMPIYGWCVTGVTSVLSIV